MSQPLRAAVLTVSDSVFQGHRRDGSGPAVKELLEKSGWKVVHSQVIADDQAVLSATLREMSSKGLEGIFTTGGTGVSPRDVTPEATRKVISREIPGLAERMRQEGAQGTPTAILSRALAGICGNSLILNLPGSPRGAVESLQAVLAVLPHAVGLITGKNGH